jgi:hypothetical protein
MGAATLKITGPARNEMSVSSRVDRYIENLAVVPKAATVRAAQQILGEYLKFANPHDIRAGVMAYLKDCQKRGNDPRTVETKRIRVLAFYRTLDVETNQWWPVIPHTE